MLSIEEEIKKLSNPFLSEFLFEIEMEMELQDGIKTHLGVENLDSCLDQFDHFKNVIQQKEDQIRDFMNISVCRQIESTFSRSFQGRRKKKNGKNQKSFQGGISGFQLYSEIEDVFDRSQVTSILVQDVLKIENFGEKIWESWIFEEVELMNLWPLKDLQTADNKGYSINYNQEQKNSFLGYKKGLMIISQKEKNNFFVIEDVEKINFQAIINHSKSCIDITSMVQIATIDNEGILNIPVEIEEDEQEGLENEKIEFSDFDFLKFADLHKLNKNGTNDACYDIQIPKLIYSGDNIDPIACKIDLKKFKKIEKNLKNLAPPCKLKQISAMKRSEMRQKMFKPVNNFQHQRKIEASEKVLKRSKMNTPPKVAIKAKYEDDIGGPKTPKYKMRHINTLIK